MIGSRRVQEHLEDLDRLRNVLDFLGAQVLEADLDLGLDLVVDVARGVAVSAATDGTAPPSVARPARRWSVVDPG